jgi:hypothetical protein
VTDAVKTPATEDEAALSSASAFRLSVDVADDEPPLQLDFNINGNVPLFSSSLSNMLISSFSL